MDKTNALIIEDAFDELWDAALPESYMPTPDPPPERRLIRAYSASIPDGGEGPSVRKPTPAHLKRYGRYFEPSIVTVGYDFHELAKQSSNDSILSIASSGLSVEEVQVAKPIIATADSFRPGNYKCVVTNFTPFTVSTETLDDKKSEDGITYSLEPLDSFSDRIASVGDLNASTAAHPLPLLRGAKWWREWRYKCCSAYRIICALTIMTNVGAIAAMISRTTKERGTFTYGGAATVTGANILVATLFRHEHIINLLFRSACALPPRTPLCIRRWAAMVYSYGGLHSGAGISAVLWYILYTVLATKQFRGNSTESSAFAAATTAILILLSFIVCMSHPYIRKRWHDHWELSHRYGGWTAVAFVWAQTMVVVVVQTDRTSHSLGNTLTTTPMFWFLIVITSILIYPWICLRRRKTKIEPLSSYAVRLHFQGKPLSTCVGYRLSHNPLIETTASQQSLTRTARKATQPSSPTPATGPKLSSTTRQITSGLAALQKWA